MHTRNELQQLALEAALRSSERMARVVLARLHEEEALAALGIECVSLFYTSIRATPEMTKALEAEYRESLQKRADQAIYSRRADAVEQERKIKQNELSTAVALEERRRELVDLQGENTRKQAEVEAESLRIRLAPYQDLASSKVVALAFRDFADNAQKIGNLTITSEILEQLLRS
jgi:regulator of protease activity HflC (stomatin/prohibitin superfamily)